MSRQVTTSSLETIGHIVGFAEERDNRPYDDGHVVPHRFTVFVPGIGPSLYAIGYRCGYAEGQAERISGGTLSE